MSLSEIMIKTHRGKTSTCRRHSIKLSLMLILRRNEAPGSVYFLPFLSMQETTYVESPSLDTFKSHLDVDLDNQL